MTDINPAAFTARETARQSTGQFGEQAHTSPETAITTPAVVTVIAQVPTSGSPAVTYPQDIPAGGEVKAGLEDSGGVFVTIEFPVEESTDNYPVVVSYGHTPDGDEWNSLQDEETGFDAETDSSIIDYLREVQAHVDENAERVRWQTTTDEVLADFVSAAIGSTKDFSDEASEARTVTRGEQLVNAFGDQGRDLEDMSADALADILMFAKSKGLDIDELLTRAVGYTEPE